MIVSKILEQHLYEGACPDIVWNSQDVPKNDSARTPQSDGHTAIECQHILMGDTLEVESAQTFAGCKLKDYRDDSYYIESSRNCDDLLQRGAYLRHKVTQEETDFPIAFSILMYEQVHQVDRLLQTIYRPQNVYCIHIDAAANPSTHNAINALTSCLPNVFMASKLIKVEYGMFTVLEAEMSCVSDLWAHTIKWKYFINLTGREFPLRTNWELVHILKAYNGANDVLGFQKK